ncbi:MAG: hypothetical protein ACE5KM_00590 [Planctomycetaceae bacterium]
MSTGSKVVIVLLCVFGGIGLLCCGGLIYVGVQFQNSTSKDPAVVAEVTKKIVEIDIPKTYQPRASVNVDFWFIPMMRMRIVVYEGQGGGSLTMMEVVNRMGGGDDDRKKFKQQMRQQGQGGNVRDLDIKESETREFTIRGQKARFSFRKGVDRETKVDFREVNGTFDGKSEGSVVVLMLQTPEEHYDEKAVVKMIRSIR